MTILTAPSDDSLQLIGLESFPEARSRLETGQRIGSFVLERRLSRRGSKSLYLARHRFSGVRAAVKLVAAPDGETGDFARSWVESGRRLIHLRHPNLAGLLEYGAEGAICYCASQLVEGVSLSAALAEYRLRPAWLPLPDVTNVIHQLAEVLDYIHEQDVVHGNLGPQNVLLDRRGGVTLTDPLMVRWPPSWGVEGMPDDGPEALLESKAPAPSSDRYALGVLLYQMLAGVRPDEGGRSAATELEGPWQPRPLLSTRPEIGPALEHVVVRSLSSWPEERFSSGKEMADALRSAVADASNASSDTERNPAARLREVLDSIPVLADSSEPDAPREAGPRRQASLGRWLMFLAGATVLGGVCAATLAASLRAVELGSRLGLAPAAVGTQLAPALPAEGGGASQEVSDADPMPSSPAPQATSSGASPLGGPPAVRPNLQIAMDGDSVTVINISSQPLSLANITFQRLAQDGAVTASFEASKWNLVAGSPVHRLPPGDCYQLRRLGTELRWPSACDILQGWLATANQGWHFWIQEEPGDVFRITRQDGLVQTCPTGETRCVFYLPPP